MCLIDEATRKDTANWVPTDDNIFLFEMPIDDAKVQETLDKAIEWYKEYVVKGVTPDYDPANKGDADMWAHLVAITSGGDDIQKDLDRLEELESEAEELEKQLKPLTDEKDALRTKIKDYMVNNKIDSIDATSGKVRAVVSVTKKQIIDKKKMAEDGIDVKKYTVTNEVKTFSLKPIKEVEIKEAE